MGVKIKELNCEIATKAESLWLGVKKETMALIEQNEHNLIINKAVLKLAEEKIKAEQ